MKTRVVAIRELISRGILSNVPGCRVSIFEVRMVLWNLTATIREKSSREKVREKFLFADISVLETKRQARLIELPDAVEAESRHVCLSVSSYLQRVDIADSNPIPRWGCVHVYVAKRSRRFLVFFVHLSSRCQNLVPDFSANSPINPNGLHTRIFLLSLFVPGKPSIKIWPV